MIRRMPDLRIDPPFVANERDMLCSFLDWYRQTLAVKCEGLTDEQLKERAVPPSPLSLLGLVRHMAEVERVWFRQVLSGEEAPPYYWDDTPDRDFQDLDSVSVQQAFANWQAEIEHARAAVAAYSSLDDVGAGTRHGQKVTLRWILIHMIEEYARHCGHADFLRERIDGVTGE